MGIKAMRLSSGRPSYDRNDDVSPNPNKFRFIVEDEEYIDGFLIATVAYPGCTTHEGRKILVFHGPWTVRGRTELDPHFIDGNMLVARFRPDELGMKMARAFVRNFTFD